MWVTALVDPDGYKIQFHSPTDVLEETEYSESDYLTSTPGR
jgi:lactoylglutathione lyase